MSNTITFARLQRIETSLSPKRALIIYGPRRVGKTTLLREYLNTQCNARILSVTGDDIRVQEVFATRSLAELSRFVSSYDLIAIDEAQQVPHIGLGIKMLIDTFPEKQFILTGSSSFELSSQVGEPLTGRHFTLHLLPLALQEMTVGRFFLEGELEQFLIYGSYPEVLLAPDTHTKEKVLNELVSSYLYKDVLALDRIKSPALLRDIARMLALQIGSEVSHNEIAVALHTNVHTIERYLDLLEKMFVIERVRGYSGNLRNEISKKARYYFLDNGVRNAVLGHFSPLARRSDAGALWENFVALELRKRDRIADIPAQYHFWRTHAGAEVDIMREYAGTLSAYECKWAPQEARVPKAWKHAYPASTFQTVHRENVLDLFLKEKA
jgi:predicted AAA+ superfamily ATPase